MFSAESRGELPEGTARRWAHETPDMKKLPEKKKKKCCKTAKYHALSVDPEAVWALLNSDPYSANRTEYRDIDDFDNPRRKKRRKYAEFVPFNVPGAGLLKLAADKQEILQKAKDKSSWLNPNHATDPTVQKKIEDLMLERVTGKDALNLWYEIQPLLTPERQWEGYEGVRDKAKNYRLPIVGLPADMSGMVKPPNVSDPRKPASRPQTQPQQQPTQRDQLNTTAQSKNQPPQTPTQPQQPQTTQPPPQNTNLSNPFKPFIDTATNFANNIGNAATAAYQGLSPNLGEWGKNFLGTLGTAGMGLYGAYSALSNWANGNTQPNQEYPQTASNIAPPHMPEQTVNGNIGRDSLGRKI